jgi:hypothetical protein
VWQKLLPEFMHNFTGFEPVKIITENVRLAQEAVLDEVTAAG